MRIGFQTTAGGPDNSQGRMLPVSSRASSAHSHAQRCATCRQCRAGCLRARAARDSTSGSKRGSQAIAKAARRCHEVARHLSGRWWRLARHRYRSVPQSCEVRKKSHSVMMASFPGAQKGPPPSVRSRLASALGFKGAIRMRAAAHLLSTTVTSPRPNKIASPSTGSVRS